jgi:hypothetical protein
MLIMPAQLKTKTEDCAVFQKKSTRAHDIRWMDGDLFASIFYLSSKYKKLGGKVRVVEVLVQRNENNRLRRILEFA